MIIKSTTFIITSIIYFDAKHLSYTNIRSSYTPDERAEQTLKTIESIKKYVPKAKIVLIEGGGKKDLPLNIQNTVDQYIYIGNLLLVKKACNSKYKGLGEAIMLLVGSKQIKKNDQYFKISGRYCLNTNFDISKWDTPGFIFKKYKNTISTRLYKFTYTHINKWKKSLIYSIPQLLINKSIEETIPKFIKKNNISYLDIIGVEGLIGPNKEFIQE